MPDGIPATAVLTFFSGADLQVGEKTVAALYRTALHPDSYCRAANVEAEDLGKVDHDAVVAKCVTSNVMAAAAHGATARFFS